MEVLNHFSHEHQLIQIEEDANSPITGNCKGCLDPIYPYPGAYYKCADENCEFYLHKYCAELPDAIQHPSHPEHQLHLANECELSCDACDRLWDDFFYGCRQCDYSLDVFCAAITGREFKHDGHKHSLLRLAKRGLFNCDACNAEQLGIFYYCSTCSAYFIHEDCFHLPRKTTHSSHPHALVLEFDLESEYFKFEHECEICGKEVDPKYWLYSCSQCRYFVHVNCATSKAEPSTSILNSIEEDEAPSIADAIQFPVDDQSITLIDYILQAVSITDDEISSTCTTSTTTTTAYHKHPLVIDMQGGSDTCRLIMNDTRVNEKICNACVKPIPPATPFFKCSIQCSDFVLHECCADLPVKIEHHPFHEHPLKLFSKSATSSNIFMCQFCEMYCSGFTYECSDCFDFNLDIHCGSLPFTIKHEAHDHVLSLRNNIIKRCNSCYNNWDEPVVAYGCDTCKNFELDLHCVLSARKVRHRYDAEHPFVLTYSPIAGHPIDYYCELCEEPLNPKHWYYHCVDCDKSLHIKCLRPFYRWSNLKYGKSYKVETHPHCLVLAPVVEDDTKFSDSLQVIVHDTKCDACDSLFKNTPTESPLNPFGFSCEECKYTVCYKCAEAYNEDDEEEDDD